jgi:4-diphosphocytidyl-2-C-methyl-D-erythritol kinase
MDKIELNSPAKINLGLYLLEKRPDGYHDILTVFQAIDLHDTLTFQKTNSTVVKTSSEGIRIPLGEDNLVLRAVRIFEKETGMKCGLEAHIIKRIPVGGGLGGGSSNAATALNACNRLFGAGLSAEQLEGLAARIGSDVSFFIRGGAAIGQGRGEILTPIEIPADYHIVLLCPDVSVSTAWAYSQAKIFLTKHEKMTNFRSIFPKFQYHALRTGLQNDLEEVVFERHPRLRLLKEELYRRDAFYASMSGSGSSVYGLFRRGDAAEAARAFFLMHGKTTVFLCRPVPAVPSGNVPP